jgi:hypothetical protein
MPSKWGKENNMDDKNKGGNQGGQEANRSEDMQKKPSQGTDMNRESQGSGNQGNQSGNQGSNQSGNQGSNQGGNQGGQQDQNRRDQEKRPA